MSAVTATMRGLRAIPWSDITLDTEDAMVTAGPHNRERNWVQENPGPAQLVCLECPLPECRQGRAGCLLGPDAYHNPRR